MLVLTRKPGERIFMHNDFGTIVVEVLEVRGEHVRLGITAPDAVKIMREEVVDE